MTQVARSAAGGTQCPARIIMRAATLTAASVGHTRLPADESEPVSELQAVAGEAFTYGARGCPTPGAGGPPGGAAGRLILPSGGP
jgi:hypothetical protein